MSKVKTAIIGLGPWGECHLQAYRSIGAEIVAVCDVDAARREAAAEKYGIDSAYGSVAEMLEREDIDLVSVATHETEHFSPSVAALKKGKHVVAEQPLATNPAAAVEIWKQAVENNVSLFVPRLLRRLAPYREVRQQIAEGRIGTLRTIEMTRSRSEALLELYHRLPTFYENLIHEMDIAMWLGGAAKFDRMQTFGSKPHRNGNRDIEKFEFLLDSGVNGKLSNLWAPATSGGRLTSGSLTCIGDEGTITIDTGELPYLLGDPWRRDGLPIPGGEELKASSFEALRGELKEICDHIRSGAGADYRSVKDANILVDVADTMLRSIDFGYSVRY